MKRFLSLSFCALSALGLLACGDNDVPPQQTPDGPLPDGPPVVFTPPTPFSFRLSPAGPDQLQSATAGPNGTFYAAGFAGASPAGPFNVVVARLTTTGPDATFGTGGVVTTALVTPGGSGEVDMATQSDGKIIVSSTVVNAAVPTDRDIAVIRLNPNGTLDTTFGVDGVRVLDLSTTGDGSTITDASRDLAVDANDNIFIHGIQKAEGNITGGVTPRIDSDFVVVKLTAAGAVDTSWGTGGKHLQDIYLSATHSGATARGIIALADGSVIAGGYSNAIGTVQPVLFKLSATGQPVTAFAGGLYHDTILTVQTEVYDLALHGDKVVTGGYGRNAGTTNDWVSLRFDATTGVRDPTWGAAPNGAVLFDPSGAMLGSNLRNAIALPGGRTLLTGSVGPANMATQDAVFAILTADGKLDTKFGTGIVKYALGANGNDQFWGGAVNGNKVLVIGYKGGLAALAAQTADVNDDAWGVIVTLP
jgi:uncharacterized delta-60 repeat protein